MAQKIFLTTIRQSASYIPIIPQKEILEEIEFTHNFLFTAIIFATILDFCTNAACVTIKNN